MPSHLSAAAWEAMFAPYDARTYQDVLDLLGPHDVVLDIGAGDLRLSRRMAGIACRVHAVEVDRSILQAGLDSPALLPDNLSVVCADARTLEFPSGITAGVLLMRHCTHFGLYAGKLRTAGAARLITNARWRMDVESVDLLAGRTPFREARMGWYACLCGAAGFKEGPAEQWSPEMDRVQTEVIDCPQCTPV
ncbi:MAG: class I SAM-dependent methyltransferase [Bacteroidota bacterium]